jgi:bromodomain-containing factor 1
VELDIDSISPAVLWQIYAHVIDHVPGITAEAEASMEDQVPAVSTPAKPAAKKKNKPMSKGEQERKIQLLENTIGDFERNSSASQEPVPSK